MSLTIEFTETSVTLDEVRKLQKEGRIRLREKPQVLSNGNVGFYLSYARFPTYFFQAPKAFKEEPSFCIEYGVRFTYREELPEGGSLPEGEYGYGEGVELMVVQHGKDRDLAEKFSNVEIIGTDLKKIRDAFVHLRSGKLEPSTPYSSSPGLVKAPAAASSDDKKGGGGEHQVPPEAATETAAA